KSRKRIIDSWKQMDFHRQSTLTIQEIAAKLNAQIRGIINYYGKVNLWSVERLFVHLDYRLAKWVENKYKSMKNSYKKSNDWLRAVKASYPNMFYHWQLF